MNSVFGNYMAKQKQQTTEKPAPVAVSDEMIEVYGAREHNLKNLDIRIPKNSLVVITGISGSGKSSLAFDTIYAEGQRRYMESFGAYARQFIGDMERPDVDKITGLSPVISIEQKTTNKNPRSTVGTITEIYDFLRLLYARGADAYSYVTGEKMASYSDDQIQELILEKFKGKRISILAPVVRARKGHYRELFEQISKQGFLKVRVDGEIKDIESGMKLDRYKVHDIETVIDRMLGQPAPDDGALAGRNPRPRPATSPPLRYSGQVGHHRPLALDELLETEPGGGLALGREQLGEARLVIAVERDEVERSGDAIGHSGAAVAAVDIDAVRSVAPRIGQEVDRLHHLPRPAQLRAVEPGKALARPLLEPGEPLVHVVGGAGAMVVAADDQPVLPVARRVQPDIMIGPERVPDQRVLDAPDGILPATT